MKISLVFKDWEKKGGIIPSEENLELSNHDFHGGSTFKGFIEVDAWQEKELRDALHHGYQPVFWLSGVTT